MCENMTNRDVLIESLKNPDGDECTVNYIACPYIVGHKCDYDGGSDHTPCTYCKMDWLDKEWDD